MFRAGDVVTIEARHWKDVPAAKRGTVRGVGLAADAAVKEIAREHGADISDRYAPHDFRLALFYDIKTTLGAWLSLQWSEYQFALQEVEAGRDVIYPVFRQLDEQSVVFLGYTSFTTLQAREPACLTGSSPYWKMSTVRECFI